MKILPQPKQFGVEYASIFQDASVVAAYPNRAPYPPQTFELLAGLIDQSVAPVRILDAGCGTGQMTSGLLPHAEQIDAVDISAAMIDAGRQMPYGADPRIRWVEGALEEAELRPPYALIVAAASLHWMPWAQTLPRLAESLSTGGVLALVETSATMGDWRSELTPLLAHYSMNQDFQPYNMLTVADELAQRGLFQQVGVMETAPVDFHQSIDAWIEAIHASNGFSRDRMAVQQVAEFDRQVRQIVAKHCPNGEVPQQIRARVIFGKPLTGLEGAACE
ncbi:MAG: class I SAM-dependent methyltransferase [Caldilineaceae bacterium]